MTSYMTRMDLDDQKHLTERVSAELAQGRILPEILADLEDEGHQRSDLQLVLRGMGAWNEQARLLRADGWAYDDLVMYLASILATPQHIAWALLLAGMRPADMLRVVLPMARGGEFQESTIQMALDCGQDLEECHRVMAWWRVGPRNQV